jgi:hypothetical protein
LIRTLHWPLTVSACICCGLRTPLTSSHRASRDTAESSGCSSSRSVAGPAAFRCGQLDLAHDHGQFTRGGKVVVDHTLHHLADVISASVRSTLKCSLSHWALAADARQERLASKGIQPCTKKTRPTSVKSLLPVPLADTAFRTTPPPRQTPRSGLCSASSNLDPARPPISELGASRSPRSV